MSSNSVGNHTRDQQIGLPLRGRPILLITRLILRLRMNILGCIRALITLKFPIANYFPSLCKMGQLL